MGSVSTRLYVVRHGAVDAKGIFYGQLDVPLSPQGREQMEAAARALSLLELAAVYSSDLQRAADGAALIAARHGLEPISDPAFREMKLGPLEGLPYEEARRLHPELATKQYSDMWEYRFPGGENLQDLSARCEPALERIIQAHAGASVALVAHNSINRLLLGRALGLPLQRVFGFIQDFGCINWIEYGEWTQVGLINWTPDALMGRMIPRLRGLHPRSVSPDPG